TESAVMALQRDYGLTVDGIVGPNTRAALAGAGAPAAPQASTGSQALRYGSTGPAVTQLQRDLASAGFYSGPFTQYYGELTQGAVINFQAAHGLAQDGIAGSNTQATLAQVLAGTPPAIASRPEPTPPPQVTPTPTETPTPEPSEPIVTEPSPSPTISASPSPAATATPEPTTAVTPEPTPTETVSETPVDEGPLPAGFIELQSNLQAYTSPSLDSQPIDSGYPLNAGQILGYVEDQGDGWIRIVGAGNGEDAWIYAGADYSGVEFRTSSQPSPEPTTSPELSLSPSPQPEATSTVVATPTPTVNAPETFFIGPSSVELSQTLTTYDVPGGTAQNLSFSAGEKLTYVGARPDCWVQVKNPSGQSTWVYAGENFGAVKFMNEGSFADIEVDPPACAPTGTAP
ncbi:MAG: peptidoglycan-binding protein, partial [Synechococcales cyanobacterium T60_A2020_003]|nr:peptidoglycan-binding protein [Synechococcales cyanobacterium T60_A2020_003]